MPGRTKTDAVPYKEPPPFTRLRDTRFTIDGVVGERLHAAIEGWLLPAPDANPALLDMFRDKSAARGLVPWAGEFVGKYLIGAQQIWHLTRDAGLRSMIHRVVDQLLGYQTDDGYLGPFPEDERLVMHWDVWGHYHVMLALLMYHEDTGRQDALDACMKMSGLFHRFFVQGGRRMLTEQDGDGEKNYAVAHGLLKLYKLTGDSVAREVADWVAKEWEQEPAGRYVSNALARTPIWEWPVKRWESLHDHQAIGEFALIDGDAECHKAFEHIWWSILEGDRHNTGGFTSSEACQGNAYDGGAIETCCTVAWAALSTDMLRMTGDSRVADEIELSLFNGIIGGQNPAGRWWTYDTPMDGVRKASAHHIVFQSRAGSPEFNCCSANAPRGLGMLEDWAILGTKDGVALNYYGPSVITAHMPNGARVQIRQETDYPLDGRVNISIGLSEPCEFTLKLRIPAWSEQTIVSINDETLDNVEPGTYLELERRWRQGDSICLKLDMSPHYWFGGRECAGKLSIYTGPLLMAFDTRFNEIALNDIPEIDPAKLKFEPVGWETDWIAEPIPWHVCRARCADGRDVVLCDFASAGATGTEYVSWLPSAVKRGPAPFSRDRAQWVDR